LFWPDFYQPHAPAKVNLVFAGSGRVHAFETSVVCVARIFVKVKIF
jgi:hypothetical protein